MQLRLLFTKKPLRRFGLLFLLIIALGILGSTWWLTHHIAFETDAQTSVEVNIPQGSSAYQAAQTIAQAGLSVSSTLLGMALQISGQADQIKAGNYLFSQPTSPWKIMNKLVQGTQKPYTVRFIEGQTFAQMRQILANNPHIRHTSKDWSEAQIMQALGQPERLAEGRFFPDTYTFHKGDSDLQILRQALAQMDQKLADVWRKRQPDLPYANPYEALTMASIIEKETSKPEERPLVSAVFVNRLRRGMRLQTDPSVIYGLGKRFNGNLTKKHLQQDNPFNSYTRKGLPPTPISAPGMSALLAAVQPSNNSKVLYFVAKGDGTSHFSHTLAEHNRAVRKYQRR